MRMGGTVVTNRFGEMENLGDSSSCHYLHSHSALERSMLFPKNVVLVDGKYGDLFGSADVFEHEGTEYVKVPILSFVKKGGVFKNFYK